MSTVQGSLFHFTKKWAYLRAILNEGFWPRYVFESDIWPPQTARAASHIPVPMVCFCDIPLHRLATHVRAYGEYGLGLSQEWAIRAGLNPVAYVNTGERFHNRLLDLGRASGFEEWQRAAAFFKPVEGIEERNGERGRKVFYEESEWRYVPDMPPGSRPWTPDQVRQGNPEITAQAVNAANAATRQHGMLLFQPTDVRYIIVRTDRQVPRVLDLIGRTRLAAANPSLGKYLISCVTSYESIARDA